MQDNNYNLIKPVENMQNVGAMTPIDRQAQKRRRNNQRERRRLPVDEQTISDDTCDSANLTGENKVEQGAIDYRA